MAWDGRAGRARVEERDRERERRRARRWSRRECVERAASLGVGVSWNSPLAIATERRRRRAPPHPTPALGLATEPATGWAVDVDVDLVIASISRSAILEIKLTDAQEESLLLTHARSCRCGGPRASWWHGPLLLSERHARARPARGHRWESGRARRSAPVGRVRNRDRRADFFDDEPRPRALRALRALRIERIERTRLVVVCGRTTSSSRSCG